MTLPDALEQLAKLADFLDREIEACGPDDEFVIAPMWGVNAMRSTREALNVVAQQIGSGTDSASAERAVERTGAKRETPDPHIGREEAQQAPTEPT